jgi:hypothetical protein
MWAAVWLIGRYDNMVSLASSQLKCSMQILEVQVTLSWDSKAPWRRQEILFMSEADTIRRMIGQKINEKLHPSRVTR